MDSGSCVFGCERVAGHEEQQWRRHRRLRQQLQAPHAVGSRVLVCVGGLRVSVRVCNSACTCVCVRMHACARGCMLECVCVRMRSCVCARVRSTSCIWKTVLVQSWHTGATDAALMALALGLTLSVMVAEEVRATATNARSMSDLSESWPSHEIKACARYSRSCVCACVCVNARVSTTGSAMVQWHNTKKLDPSPTAAYSTADFR